MCILLWSQFASPGLAHEGHASGIAVGSPENLLALYSLLIAMAAMAGGFLPELVQMTHIRMQMSLSAIGGLILGIAVLHLWPHAVHELGENGADRAATWMMAGMVGTFLMLRLFHFHHHGQTHPAQEIQWSLSPESLPLDSQALPQLPLVKVGHGREQTNCDHDHAHPHDHNHDHQHASSPPPGGSYRNAWLGTVIGLAIHTLSDGVALGAALAAGSGTGNWPALGVFLAICLHKPLDTMTVAMLMKASGWSLTARTIVVMLLSTACPIGAGLMWGFASPGSGEGIPYVGYALAIAAGIFLCIALGDLLPEMEFHDHNRWMLTSLLLLGIAVAWGLRYLEPHHHGPSAPTDGEAMPFTETLSPQIQ